MTCKYGVFFLINSAMIFLLTVPSYYLKEWRKNIAKIDFSYKLLFFFSFSFCFYDFFNLIPLKNCLNIFLHPLLTFLLWYQTQKNVWFIINFFFISVFNFFFLYLRSDYLFLLYFFLFSGTFYPVDRVL